MSDLFEQMQRWVVSLPHCATLGLRFAGMAHQKVTLALDWREDLVGNPTSGVLHGGVITSLVDSTSALAVFTRLAAAEAMATLDLRIDYLRAAEPRQPVFCEAECYHLTRQIAFTRAICHQGNREDPLAHGVATFMRASSRAVFGHGEKT